jgi:flagellar hook-associated protein 2
MGGALNAAHSFLPGVKMSAITFSGLNGIDFNSILEAVMQYESQPLKAMQADQLKIQNKDAAFVSLGGIISALQTPVNSLIGASSFSKVKASSSDPTIATVTAGEGATIGQYNVSITQLAKAQVTKSTNGYSASTDVAATGGQISFTINGQTTEAITITADTTLAQLAQAINAQGSGVKASVVNDGTNYKLVISSRETGETNGFTINNSLTNSSGTVVAFAAGQSPTSGNAQNAQNALFNVDGIDIERASNTVSDAVPGISLTMLKAGDVSINSVSDYSSIKDNLKALVTQYNKLRQFYNDQAKGPLGGDSLLREVLSDLKTVLLTANSNGGRYHYLSEIGLELTSSGELKLDETKLDAAIGSYSGDVQKLFQGATGSDGVFNTLIGTLKNLDGNTGLIKTTRDTIKSTLTKYDDRIEQQQRLLDIRRQALMKMYAAADEAIARLNQMNASISNLQRSL